MNKNSGFHSIAPNPTSITAASDNALTASNVKMSVLILVITSHALLLLYFSSRR